MFCVDLIKMDLAFPFNPHTTPVAEAQTYLLVSQIPRRHREAVEIKIRSKIRKELVGNVVHLLVVRTSQEQRSPFHPRPETVHAIVQDIPDLVLSLPRPDDRPVQRLKNIQIHIQQPDPPVSQIPLHTPKHLFIRRYLLRWAT